MQQEYFVWTLFQQLRRRNFALGPEEYDLLRQALMMGYGWQSRKTLRELCIALWAKSHEERAVVATLFDQHVVSDWTFDSDEEVATAKPVAREGSVVADQSDPAEQGVTPSPAKQPVEADFPVAPVAEATGRLPSLNRSELPPLPFEHIFLPQYPMNYRATAQAWRRLRWSIREGPATELDVDATIERRSRDGMVSPPVLRPIRRNRARLLLLVDRKGSMAPFHSYVDQVCRTISQTGRLGQVAVFYFHDVPLEGADQSMLEGLAGGIFSNLDSIIVQLPPLNTGELFKDAELLEPLPARPLLAEHARDAAVVIISDAGAARGKYDLLRLLDTIAFLKGLMEISSRVVWLNPLPASNWTPSSAGEIARHIPMFPMNQEGIYRAVNVLRGQPYVIDRPIAVSTPLPKGHSAGGAVAP
jgi:uncharacterized protein with von Willebrand factor type A (vWA) domain